MILIIVMYYFCLCFTDIKLHMGTVPYILEIVRIRLIHTSIVPPQGSEEGDTEEGEVEEGPSTSNSTSQPSTSALVSAEGSMSEQAKKMRVEEEMEKKTLFDVSRVVTKTVLESESCLHEAITPVDFDWQDLKPLTTKPAKEYPFILDPFQQEALKCIQNDRLANMLRSIR